MAWEDNSSNDSCKKSISEMAKVKLDNMSREFQELRRRVPLQHLTTPRSLFIQSVPETKCDVVITLTKGVPDSTLLWLLHKLRSSEPELQVIVRQHTHTQCTAFYITADDNLLLRTAEEMHLPKLLKDEYGGGFVEFNVADLPRFRNSDKVENFFTSQQRHYLVKHILMAARATFEDVVASHTNTPADTSGTPSDFGIGITMRAGQCIVPLCLSQGVIESVFPLHDQGDDSLLKKLKKNWVKQPFALQPLDDIAEYFGVKVALYFAWLGHFTASLTAPAIIGLLTWFWLHSASEDAKDMGQVIFSCFNILWAVVHLITWRRYSSVLAWRWGTLDMRDELLAEPRPQFQGILQKSPVTGRMEVMYPPWRRRFVKVFVSGPVLVCCIGVAAFNTYGVLRFQDWWDSNLYYLTFIPRALLALLIAIQEKVYEKIAFYLNEIENYRLETKYENHLIFKISVFQFVNSHMSLFYLAFYREDMDKLTEQLAALLITRQILGNLKESALPYFREQLKYAKLSLEAFGALTPSRVEKKEDDHLPNGTEPSADGILSSANNQNANEPTVNRSMGQAEVESQLYEYPGTFQEYSELMTQLCHVLLFSWACPPAAACALINNIIEIRTDAFKLCHVVKRPFGERVNSIGGWQTVMECVALAALMVNCFRVALSTKIKSLDLLTLICVEHAVLLAVVLLHVLIPAVPEWLAEHMARIEYKRREAVKNTLGQNRPFEPLQLGRFTVKHSTTPIRTPLGGDPNVTSSSDEGAKEKKPDKERKKMVIPEIPPFKPKAVAASPSPVSSSPSVISTPIARNVLDTRTILDSSPTKPSSHKDTQLTVQGPSVLQNLKASEHLHRSAQHIPSHVNKDVQSESRGSEPELTFGSSPPQAQLKTPRELKAAHISSTDVSSEDEKPKVGSAPVKTSRAKAALVKRARSVAVFSLRLRKAREAREAENKQAAEQTPEQALPAPILGGELNLIPIEKLIQMEDISKPKSGN